MWVVLPVANTARTSTSWSWLLVCPVSRSSFAVIRISRGVAPGTAFTSVGAPAVPTGRTRICHSVTAATPGPSVQSHRSSAALRSAPHCSAPCAIGRAGAVMGGSVPVGSSTVNGAVQDRVVDHVPSPREAASTRVTTCSTCPSSGRSASSATASVETVRHIPAGRSRVRGARVCPRTATGAVPPGATAVHRAGDSAAPQSEPVR